MIQIKGGKKYVSSNLLFCARKKVASVDIFASKNDAFEFIENDSKNVFDEEVNQGAKKDELYYTLDNNHAYVASYNGEFQWTWNLVEVEDPLDTTLKKFAKKACDESAYDYKNWWNEDFDSEIHCSSSEEFKNLSSDQKEKFKSDWLDFAKEMIVDHMMDEVNAVDVLRNIHSIAAQEILKRMK